MSQGNVKKAKKKWKRKLKSRKDKDKKDTKDCKSNDLKENNSDNTKSNRNLFVDKNDEAVVYKKQNTVNEKIDPVTRPDGIKCGRTYVAIDTTKCSGKINLKAEKKDLHSTFEDHCKPKKGDTNVHAVIPKGKKAKKQRRRKNKGKKGLEKKGTNEGNTCGLKEDLLKKNNSDKTEGSRSLYVNKDYEAIVQKKQTKSYEENFPETRLDGANAYRKYVAIDTTESSAKVNLEAESEDSPSELKDHRPLENGDTEVCMEKQSTISSPNSAINLENDGKTELKNEQRDNSDIKESLEIIKNLVNALLRAKSGTPKIISVYQTNEESSKDVKTKIRRKKLNPENKPRERVELPVGLENQLQTERENKCTRDNQTQKFGQTNSREENLIKFQATSNNKPKQVNDVDHMDVLENVSEELQDCENLATTQKERKLICRNPFDLGKPLFVKDNQKSIGIAAFNNVSFIDGNDDKEKCKTSNDAIEIELKVEANVSDETKISIEFTKGNLTLGRQVPVVCNLCHAENHHFQKCPLVYPKYKPLKSLTKGWIKQLESVCSKVYHDLEPTLEERQIRIRIREFLENHLKMTFSGM